MTGDGSNDMFKAVRSGTTRVVIKNGVNTLGINTDTINNPLTVNGGADFSGNVGIGVTSPGYRLVVNSATDGISAGISGNTYGIRFDNGGTFSSGMSTIHGVDNTLVGSYQPIMLNGSDVRFGTSATERMRITSGGNVGIGTTSPNRKLEIATGEAVTNGIRLTKSTGVTSEGMDITYLDSGNTTTSFDSIYNSDSAVMRFRMKTGGTAVTALTILGSGAVTKGSQPFAMGGLASNQSISASTFTPLAFQTNQGFYGVNTGGCWNNSTYTFTAPVTGVYIVNVSLLTNSLGQVALFVNGTRKHSIPSWYVSSSITWGGSALIPLTAGEALTLQGYGNAGIVEANQYHTFFSIYLLG
jgi:hypothetical protein